MLEMNYILLFVLCAFTSTMTAAVGAGGGTLLLAFLPNVLAPHLVIPIHGATQLASNLSRLALDWRMARWRDIILPYLPGALAGGVIGYFALGRFSFEYLPLILGVFVLLVTWTNLVQRSGVLLNNMTLLGLVQTALSLFVGAFGMIVPAILLRKGLKKDETIVTQSAMISIMHAFKVATYVAAGFAFFEHIPLMAMMLLGAVAGSWLGKRLRGKINEEQGVWLMKWLITIAAVQLVVSSSFSF